MKEGEWTERFEIPRDEAVERCRRNEYPIVPHVRVPSTLSLADLPATVLPIPNGKTSPSQ